ncbi:hypothetical protein [Acinetobacter bereziniae]|uniref:hypothetical protein n=1 Tax=Acinetobacter bereziniae TaxID=106648 RepID=UPI001250876A|nr:hypothetical protein [Acinetobacter bereziniae]
MNYKRYILNFFSLDRSNLLKFSLSFLLNLVIILIFSILSIFILYLLTIITYKSVISFVGLIFGAKIYLKISLLVLLIILLKLQGRRRYVKYFDAKLSRYIKKQDKDDLNKYKMILKILGIYILISVLGLVVYRVSGNDLSTSNKSDLINIFIWATYLIAPIVAIWVFSSWKIEFRERAKYQALSELEGKINNISQYFNKLNKMIRLTWDEKNLKIANARCMQSFFNRDDFKNIFFHFNILHNMETNFLDILEKDRKRALQSYNDFILSRANFNILDNEVKNLNEFDSAVLYDLKAKLSSVSTMILSDNLFENISKNYPLSQSTQWINQCIKMKKDTIDIDFNDFNLCVNKMLKEIKLQKIKIIND